jgi:hypothetical protein
VAPTDLGIVIDQWPKEPPARPIAQIETKAHPGDMAEVAVRASRLSGVVYVESMGDVGGSFLGQISHLRAEGYDVRAKIRTGGASAAAFPSVEEVASFIEASVNRAIPFKATAGLHHPIRVASAVEDATEHGFINVLAAVRAALAGDGETCRDSLESRDPGDFDVTAATWRGVGAQVPAIILRQTFRSFGSCSFDEPVGYLRELGVLPLEAAR